MELGLRGRRALVTGASQGIGRAVARGKLAPDGILVNSVNIGLVLTPQWENIRAHLAPGADFGTFTSGMAKRSVPLGRFGTPEEVSGLIAFLCSDRASYIAGASIDVSEGLGSYV